MQDSEQPKQIRRKRGRTPKEEIDKRDHCVSVRMNITELAKLDQDRAKLDLKRGEMLRHAFLRTTPPAPPPAINVEAWRDLARAQANINQIAKRLNMSADADADADVAFEIEETLSALKEFRNQLISVSVR